MAQSKRKPVVRAALVEAMVEWEHVFIFVENVKREIEVLRVSLEAGVFEI